MPTGVITRPMHSKGYGFIQPDSGGEDVFFHVKDLVTGEESDLSPGTHLSYQVKTGRKGPQASDVRVVEAPAEEYDAGETGTNEDWRAVIDGIVQKHARALADELCTVLGV